ncbi:hypothetical protein F4808DRAFT_300424 [Astrocystis sublimbata]|nr:hypothetical protein F4808DRAFT_300424 [Astrocystis sublimbata]
MNQYSNPEQQEIELLRAQLKNREAQLRSRDDDLEKARQQLFYHLQSSALQPSSITFDTYSDTQLSAVPVNPSRSTPRARTASAKLHRHHVDQRTSHPFRNGDELHLHAVKRPRTMSQQMPSSHRMDRVASNLSTRSAGPFTGNSPVSPPPTFNAKHADRGNYLGHNNALASQAFTSNLMQQFPVDEQQHRLSSFVETGFATTSNVYDPAVWLAAQEDLSPDVTINQSDIDAQFNMSISGCESMTSGPTWDNNTAPMTRQNSQFDSPSTEGGVHMMNVGSQTSQGVFTPENMQMFDYGDPSSFVGKQPSHEQALFAVGSNLEQYTTTSPNEEILAPSDMERSLSSTSTTSAKSMQSSLSARAKDTLARQNHRAQIAPLKPKPSLDETNKPEPPSNGKDDGKAAITKAKYIRPRQPKVFCKLCNDHKEGFRGEHELRRHRDAKHQQLVKKFVCQDPAEQGLPHNVQAVNPLNKCKACKAGKKYGAYYNAAAHLRRTHFKEKPSRSKKNAGANGGDEDKRGGKGGGDWPSMHELKNWMREVYVTQDELLPKEEDDADEDLDNKAQPFFGGGSDAEGSPNVDGQQQQQHPSSFVSTGMPTIDSYGFHNPLTINTLHHGQNTDLAYMAATMPLSSADFTFNSPSSNNMPPLPYNMNTDVAAYSTIIDHHMNMNPTPLSSAVSSSATVTPLTAFNEQHHFDNAGFQY